jgi:hypothetical protein
MTEAGSMNEPEFVFRFADVRPANTSQQAARVLAPQGKVPETSSARTAPTEGVSIPFVGCPSDGQVGPGIPPSGKAPIMPIGPEAAQRLAYYKSEAGPGVLAPRGWYCFGEYGSSGDTLYVIPQPIDGNRFAGPALEIARLYGGTSGRFGVARIIARVFPAHKAFVTSVIEEGIEPASSFPFGPYPLDRLTYRSNEIVEYQTPAQTDGLGTASWLRKNDSPIEGVAILTGEGPDLLQLSVRLPAELNSLTSFIIQQAERDASSK